MVFVHLVIDEQSILLVITYIVLTPNIHVRVTPLIVKLYDA